MDKVRRHALLLLLAVLVSSCGIVGGSGAEPSPEGALVRFDGGTVTVDVSDEPDEWRYGLRYRPDKDTGLLFAYPRAVGDGFVHRAMFPISMALMRRVSELEYRVVALRDLTPCTEEVCPTYAFGRLYDVALQVDRGWFEDAGVKLGSHASIEPGADITLPPADQSRRATPTPPASFPELGRGTARFGSEVLELEVADSPDERSIGLMRRERLDRDAGMLFVFSEPTGTGFWMRNTLIPLSIAFLTREDGERYVVRAILDMEPCRTRECPTYAPGLLYDVAIEVNQGWFRSVGIEVGSRGTIEAS